MDNLKSIIDPLKTSTLNIDLFIKDTNFKQNSIIESKFIIFYLFFGDLFFGSESSEDNEDILLSESDSESDSE